MAWKLFRLEKHRDGLLYLAGTQTKANIVQQDLDPCPFESNNGHIPTQRELEKEISAWPHTKIQGANAYRIPTSQFGAWNGHFKCAIPLYAISNLVKATDEQMELGLEIPQNLSISFYPSKNSF